MEHDGGDDLPGCCPALRAAVADPRVPLRWSPAFRELRIVADTHGLAPALGACPFCGTRNAPEEPPRP